MRNNSHPDQISLFQPVQNGGATERERERESTFARHGYNNIISIENLLTSWREFLKGKGNRKDVAEFSVNFIHNIYSLHQDLVDRSYRHGDYHFFKINDPKPRHIHKAPVRDRLVHHAIHRILYPYFDRKFIFDSYSCRVDKGTHRAMNRFKYFAGKVSQNHTCTAWILKCDVEKFFATIDHEILKKILRRYINDENVLWLLNEVIDSFQSSGKSGVGLPLGNLTSQLFINIYMNQLDQFVKRSLKVRCYIRYADDFVILYKDRKYLQNLIPKLSEFLKIKLKLSLHPKKVFIKTHYSGVDFLGWIHFPHHRVLRTSTKRRMLNKLKNTKSKESIASYSGLLSHGNTYKLSRKFKRNYLKFILIRQREYPEIC